MTKNIFIIRKNKSKKINKTVSKDPMTGIKEFVFFKLVIKLQLFLIYKDLFLVIIALYKK